MKLKILLILAVVGCALRGIGFADSLPRPMASAHPETMTGETKQLYDNWQELKKRHLRLLPVPKIIQFNGNIVDVDNIAVVLVNKTKQGEIAANEIMSRVKELSGMTPPCVAEIQEGKFNVVIENSYPNFLTQNHEAVKTANQYCREQAYGIEPFDKGVRLAGNSPLGMMYAAVTLRWLIEREGHQAVFHVASATDWPDFPRRQILRLPVLNAELQKHLKSNAPEDYLDFQKRIIDWAFRYKINMVYQHTVGAGYSVTPFDDDGLSGKEKYFECAKAVGIYLKEHGIGAMDCNYTYFGKVEKLSKNPELKNCSNFRFSEGTLYGSWAFDDLHRRKAEKLTKFWENCGYSTAFIHDLDNIACWEKRDESTKRQYGNDRTAANIGMFKTYYEAFRQKGLELAIVTLPYHGYNFWGDAYLSGKEKRGQMEDTIENRKKAELLASEYSNHIRKISEAFPKDVMFCIREGTRREMLNFYNMIQGHPAFIYYQEFQPDDGMKTRFLPATIATFATAFDTERNQNDIFKWASDAGPHGITCAAEYAWNVKFPGGNESMQGFDRNAYSLGINDPALMDVMAERAAVGLWGDKYGQILKGMMNNDLSLAYPFSDRSCKGKSFENYQANLMENEKFLKLAEAVLDSVWNMDNAARKNSRTHLDGGFSYEYFVALRNVIKIAKIFNAAHAACADAQRKIAAGKQQEASSAIDDALRLLPAAIERYEINRKEMAGKYDPEYSYLSNQIKDIMGISPGISSGNFSKLLEIELDRLKNNKDLTKSGPPKITSAQSQAASEFKMMVKNGKMKPVTIDEGTGSLVSFELYLELPAAINGIKITASLLNNSRENVVMPFELLNSPKLQPIPPRIDVQKEVRAQYDSLSLSLMAEFVTSEGKKHVKKSEFIIGEKE